MAVNKLNIEFEDDDEIKAREEAERRRKEAVEDVDLEFGVESDNKSSGKTGVHDVTKAREAAKRRAAQQEGEGKSPQPQSHTQPAAQSQSNHGQLQFNNLPQQQVFIGPDYKLGDELKKVAASNQILAVEIEARVKVEVTQEMAKVTAEYHAEAKLLEHKINKILSQINQKVPALKNELMTIKKMLAQHASLDDEVEGPSEQQRPRPQGVAPKKKAA